MCVVCLMLELSGPENDKLVWHGMPTWIRLNNALGPTSLTHANVVNLGADKPRIVASSAFAQKAEPVRRSPLDSYPGLYSVRACASIRREQPAIGQALPFLSDHRTA
jgi:hypothetical protein